MKKQIFFPLLCSLLVLGLCQTAFSQISVGIRGGILINNADIDPLNQDEPNPKSILGFQLAMPVEISIGEMFAIQPEIMFGSHGYKRHPEETVTNGITSKTTYKFVENALELPVLVKLKFDTKPLKFYVLAGPSFGFGTGGEFTAKYSKITKDATGDIINELNEIERLDLKFVKNGYAYGTLGAEYPASRTNINLHVGAGLSIPVGPILIFFDGRYIHGLSDHFPDVFNGPALEDDTTKSRRIGLSVGVMFPIRNK